LNGPPPPPNSSAISDPGPSGEDADMSANLAMSDHRVPRRLAFGSVDVGVL
jgi:hypothetical protein